ncbi:hypothetical protein F2Q70_00017231 [Brassica cretica]|uniref:Uncharacterized protein n=2 Tax=Brassica cretica TaxID=69181 RepID=A0A8S9I5I2_BRACR|nr:hypothetical protein F2Q70_00017231 [Brassica cretica]
MDEPSQSNHHGGHVFAVLLRSMCRWNGGVGTSSHLVGLRTLPRSKLDCSDFAGVLRLECMSRAELVVCFLSHVPSRKRRVAGNLSLSKQNTRL